MTIYSRSDVVSVTVGRSHGGCGQVHSRPVVNGAPAKLWGLDCPTCEKHLAYDPLWSSTLSDVPDTLDEVSARDNVTRHTARSRDDLVALALAKIAGLPVAEFLGEMVGQSGNQGTVQCSAGHENFPTAKFCGECGDALQKNAAISSSDAAVTHADVTVPTRNDVDDNVTPPVTGTIVPPMRPQRGPGRPRKTVNAG